MSAFHSLYSQGFLRVAAGAPHSRVADPAFNVAAIIAMCRDAAARRAGLVVFPELALSSYAIDDLLHQDALLKAVEHAVEDLLAVSCSLLPVILVGAPVRFRARLYNCALVIHRGVLLGIVPKTYLPNYREFYERRHFASGSGVSAETVRYAGQETPFGTDIIFEATDVPGFRLAAEICEDVWVPVPPSSNAALAGATVIANLSASNAVVGKADYRHLLCKAHSGRCLAAYVYTASGPGESTTDLAWDGQCAIYENGATLVEAPRFAREPAIIVADVDLAMLEQERMRQGTFGDNADDTFAPEFRRVPFELAPPLEEDLGLARKISRYPFVPDEDARLDELCFEAFNIQAHGLRQRLESTGLKKVVIGVSGGLDSTQALLVICTAFDQLGLSRENILAYTLPAFATSAATKDSAWALMRALGVTSAEVDMTPACRQMLTDIGHPYSRGEKVYDATFENVQAGARTSFLFRAANASGAIVVGTGDLSELALGWCTYGVGDQNVALQRQRVGAEDVDPASHPLVRGGCAVRPERWTDPPEDTCYGNLAGTRAGRHARRDTEDGGFRRPLQSAGLLALLHHAVRLLAEARRVPRLACVARCGEGRLAAEYLCRQEGRLRSCRDQKVDARLRHALFLDEPVQALCDAERAEGHGWWLAVAARRLACAERLVGGRVARRGRAHPRLKSFGSRLARGTASRICSRQRRSPQGPSEEACRGDRMAMTDER